MKNCNSDYIEKAVHKPLDEVYLALPNNIFKESETAKIKEIELVVHYENPLAYGFPERCFWEERYSIDIDLEKENKNEKH